jgi:hypothetical protein
MIDVKTITIEEMDRDQLEAVFNANQGLRQAITDDMIDTEMMWISDQIDFIRKSLSDWSIGINQHNYITVKDHDGFLDGMLKMDNSVPAFTDKEAEELHAVIALRDEVNSTNVYEDGFDELVEQLDTATEDLAGSLADNFTRRLEHCYGREAQFDYFLDFYAEERLDGTEYIQDDTFILYEDISYTKSFND